VSPGRGSAALLGAALAAGLVAAPARAATIDRTYADAPGMGVNDPTPAAPVAGNPGTTVGQQRKVVVDRALDVWAARLVSSQTIYVAVTFSQDLPCTDNAAAVGAARADHALLYTGPAGNPHPIPNVGYPAALFDRLIGEDAEPDRYDVVAAFNGRLGKPGCSQGAGFYYGLDGQAPGNTVDLFLTVLHEFAHAIGFAGAADDDTAEFPTDAGGVARPDVFSYFLYDDRLGKRWPQMTAAERLSSRQASGHLLWDGPGTTAVSTRFPPPGGCTGAGGRMRMYAPASYTPGSSVAHWDTSCEPDLLMGPFVGSESSLDITPVTLADLGWALAGACGDGTGDAGEGCDEGAANGTPASACTAACTPKQAGTCGNGTRNGAEACDDGAANGSPWSCCTTGCAFKTAGSVCRPAAGACDVAEACNGQSAQCPADAPAPAGSACDDGNPCTTGETCQAGACGGGTPPSCPAADECHAPGVCQTVSGRCSSPPRPNGTPCSGGACMAGACVPLPAPPEPPPDAALPADGPAPALDAAAVPPPVDAPPVVLTPDAGVDAAPPPLPPPPPPPLDGAPAAGDIATATADAPPARGQDARSTTVAEVGVPRLPDPVAVPADAGAAREAGPADAAPSGMAMADAAAPPKLPPAADAATTAPPGSYPTPTAPRKEAGGCACAVASAGGPGPGALPLALALLWPLARTRRRRRASGLSLRE
jgi:MYXO-CTERM domain-containing protein